MDEARSHFDLGVSHFDREEWQAALVEFVRSRELYPTKGNTKNAAICLRKVGRFDEAVDLFQALLREFPDLSAPDRELATHELAELQASIGTIEVRDAPPGAAVTIDALGRGKVPLAGPIRIAAGTHIVRVTLDGALPFETLVDLAGRQAAVVHAHVLALTRAGRLRITEHDGTPLEVVVDGAVVGGTPWEGALAPGLHTVLSRGAGTLGTTPVEVSVQLDQITALELRATELPSTLHIDAQPGAAEIRVDGVPVGRGAWEGRVQTGAHRVTVSLEGYVPFARDATLSTAVREVIAAELRTIAAEKPRFALEVDGGLALGPVWGGDLVRRCSAGCSGGLPLGARARLHATYEAPFGFGAGLHAGYLLLERSLGQRPESLQLVGAMQPLAGLAADSMRLDGLTAGAHAQYETRSRWPVTLRLAVGVLVGSIRDRRTATFAGVSGDVAAEQRQGAAYFYVGPEVRIARKLGEHLEIGVGIEVLLAAALSAPVWNSSTPVVVTATSLPGRSQEATFPASSLAGAFLLLASPQLGVSYEF